MERGHLLMLITTILAIIIICFIEGKCLLKNKSWRELSVFGLLLVIALLLAIGNQLNLTGPIAWLDQFVSPLGRSIFRSF